MIDKSLISGSTTMLILKLLESKDMYGYEMIEELHKQSNQTFDLKAGTLYPLLHGLEKNGCVTVYESQAENGRKRKYYQLTKNGKKILIDKRDEWDSFTEAVNHVLKEGASYGV